MCYSLYLGTDTECTTSEWKEKEIFFYLEDLRDVDIEIKKKFSKSNVYYVGSWQGCSCGYFCSPEYAETESDLEEINYTKKSIIKFVEFTKQKLKEESKLEIYLCWEGDQYLEPKRKYTTTPDKLIGTSLQMEDLDFITIKK
jgi:hypothetical protein